MNLENSGNNTEAGFAIAAIQRQEQSTIDVDKLIFDFACSLRTQGYRVGGVAQINLTPPGARHCDMLLEELTSGEQVRISQRLGAGSSGCRLDSSALEHITGMVEASLAGELDVLIINKFGKQEADGMGLRGAIARAVEKDIPVLVGLNPTLNDAWDTFCGGAGEILDADPALLHNWMEKNTTRPVSQLIPIKVSATRAQ